MIVKALDVIGSHINNPSCSMRIAQDPKGNWYCADCGVEIIWKAVGVVETLAEQPPQEGRGRDT